MQRIVYEELNNSINADVASNKNTNNVQGYWMILIYQLLKRPYILITTLPNQNISLDALTLPILQFKCLFQNHVL